MILVVLTLEGEIESSSAAYMIELKVSLLFFCPFLGESSAMVRGDGT